MSRTPLAGARSRRLLVLVAMLPVAAVLSLGLGANAVGPQELWHAVVSPTGAEGDVVVRSLRLPRTVLGLLVGAALGAAGVLMQGHTRNAAAEPGLLGVSAGAAISVVIGLRLGLVSSLLGTVGAAAVGALLASLAVYALARRSMAHGSPTLVVAGAAVSALLTSVTSAVVLLDAETLDAYRFWAVGSLAGRDPATAAVTWPFVAVGLLLALLNARSLDLLALGDDVATSMGLSVRRARLVGVLAITLLTAAGVAACGPIAFVGLLAGHLARALLGSGWLTTVVAGTLLGAVFVVLADVVGRLVAGPGELQVGVVAGLVGAPLLIWMVRRRELAL